MDTASSLVSRTDRIARLAPALLALALVGLSLLVVLGVSLGAVGEAAQADPLLGPFRWSSRGVA